MDLEANEKKDVEKKINQLTSFLNSHINQFKEFRPVLEQYFLLHYDEKAQKKEKKKAGEEAELPDSYVMTNSVLVFMKPKSQGRFSVSSTQRTVPVILVTNSFPIHRWGSTRGAGDRAFQANRSGRRYDQGQ